MSLDAIKWVWANSPYEGAALILHLAIADVVSDKHNNLCWMSEKQIIEKTRCAARTVQRAKERMIADGLLEVVDDSHGPGKSNTYRFLMPENANFRKRVDDRTGVMVTGVDDRTGVMVTGVDDRTGVMVTGEQPPSETEQPPSCRVFENDTINAFNSKEPKVNPNALAEGDDADLALEDSTPASHELQAVSGEENLGAAGVQPFGGEGKGRKPDLVFEAIAEVCRMDLKFITTNERGQLNAARKQLRVLEATPEQVRTKAELYRRIFPHAILTPMALVNNWSKLIPENLPGGGVPEPTDEEIWAQVRALEAQCERANPGGIGSQQRSERPAYVSVDRDRAANGSERSFLRYSGIDGGGGDGAGVPRYRAGADHSAEPVIPKAPTVDRRKPSDADSRRSAAVEHGSLPNTFLDGSNRATAPLTAKSPPSIHDNGSLPSVERPESPDDATQSETLAQRLENKATVKKIIAGLAGQLSHPDFFRKDDPEEEYDDYQDREYDDYDTDPEKAEPAW